MASAGVLPCTCSITAALSLELGVLMHELGWAADDHDRPAAGSHLVQGPVHRYELPGIHAMNLEGAHPGRGVLYHPGGW